MKRIFAILFLAAMLVATMLLCASCSKDKDAVEATHNHTPGEAVVEDLVVGTCMVNGSYNSCVYCIDCDKLLEITVVTTSVACGQCTPGEPVVEENARPVTCTEDGGWYRVTSCTVCGEVISEELITDDPTKPFTRTEGHKWDSEDTYEVGATCTTHGGVYKAPKCSVCDELDYANSTLINNTEKALGHDVTSGYHTKTTKATCIADGKIEEILSCDRCNTEINVHLVKTLPKSGHTNSDPVKENEEPATCTENGKYDEVVYCSVCSAEVSRKEVEVKAAHTLGNAVKENNIFSDCEKGGSYDQVKYCTVCFVECERINVKIEAAEHNKTTVTKTLEPATCTKDGKCLEVTICLVCEKIFAEKEVTVPASHTTETTTTTVNPSCEANGSTTVVVKCTVCERTISRTTTPIPATGHTAGAAARENIVESTCEEKGSYNEVVRCTKCSKALSSVAKEIPAKGHTHSVTLEENWHNKSVDGCYDLVVYCLTCGVERSRETVAHTPGSTMTEVHDDAVYCTTCDEEVSRVTIGHEYVDRFCIRCLEYDFSEGLKYEISEDKSHWIVVGRGTCTDDYIIAPREHTGKYTYIDESDPKNPREVTVTVTLPVAEIDRWAFYDCNSIKRVLILKEMQIIPDMAFYGCDNLVSIAVEQGNSKYMSVDGNLYLYETDNQNKKNPTVLMQYAIGKSETSFAVPSGVKEIAYGAFACDNTLKSVTIANSVTVIRESAFSFCTVLQTIVIPEAVTEIGEAAFADCHNLVSVVIGSGVKSIGKDAFRSCTKLTSVTFNSTSGWKVSTTQSGSKTAVSGLGNKATAASYLTTTYMNYYWTR